MGFCSDFQCYIPSFVEIGPPVPEKIFEGFLPYMGRGHVGHETQMPRTNFRSPYPRRFHIKSDQAVLEKMFENVDGHWAIGIL